jgi:hypothetical protein
MSRPTKTHKASGIFGFGLTFFHPVSQYLNSNNLSKVENVSRTLLHKAQFLKNLNDPYLNK